MDKDYFDRQFNYYLSQPFEALRVEYRQRCIDWEDALAMHQKLIDRLGIEDPEGPLTENPPWVQSSWCLGG